MQPNTWKYFPFPKIAIPKNIYFPENILHEPNTAIMTQNFDTSPNNKKTVSPLKTIKPAHCFFLPDGSEFIIS